MKNRLQRAIWLILLVFISLFGVREHLNAQDFIFNYTGPDTILMDNNCAATLNWGIFTPTVSPAHPGDGQAITFFDIDNISGGYSVNDMIPSGEVVSITYLALDNQGNDSTFTFSIDFVDAIAPTFDLASMPGNASYACIANVPMPPNISTLIAMDNCPPPGGTSNGTTITYNGESAPPVGCNGGAFTRTWTVTDDTGNSNQYTQIITINGDVDPPVITGTPLGATEDCATADYAAWIAAQRLAFTAVDNGCGLASISDDAPATFSSNCASVEVTFTATDDCGLTSTVVVTYAVEDNDDPVITPPGMTTVTIQCTGVPADPVSQIMTWAEDNFTVSDNCGMISWTNDFTGLNGGCGGSTGTASVTYTASDGCGNTDNVTINFTVEDSNPPNILMGAIDTVVVCDGAGNTIDLMNWLNNRAGSVATDICTASGDIVEMLQLTTGVPTTPQDIQTALDAQLASGCGGLVTVRFVYTDACGNMSTSDADFEVIDNTSPIWNNAPQGLTIECDGTVDPAGAIAAWLMTNGGGTAIDECSSVTITNNYAGLMMPSCNAFTGSAMVTFTAMDQCGNPATATATVTIEDTTPALLGNIPMDMTINCGDVIPGDPGNVTAMDACEGNITASIVFTQGALVVGSCPNTGTITNTWTVTDACGNMASSAQVITIVDNAAAMFTAVPADVSIECGAMIPGDSGTVMATDICQGNITADIVFAQSNLNTGSCPNTGTILNTWTVTDVCGNTATTTQTITITDNTDPVIMPSASNTMVECDGNGNLTELNAWLSMNAGAMATDNCNMVSWSNLVVGMNPACNGTTNTLTYEFTAMDECGNTSTTSADFIIIDTSKPILTSMASDITVECEDSNAMSLADWAATHGGAVATDNCSTITDASWSYVAGQPMQGCLNTYTQVVVFTVTDECGLTESTTANYIVQDKISPQIFPTSTNHNEECDGVDDVAALLTWISSQGGAMATDGCSMENWVDFDYVTSDGDMANNVVFGDLNNYPLVANNDCAWSVEITFRVKDDCDNTSTTTSTFSIIDTTDPVIFGIPADVTVSCDNVPAEMILPATDNCDAFVFVSLNADTLMGNCPGNYVITRTWTAVDDCNNGDVVSQIITVQDITNPTLANVPSDLTVSCDMVPVAANNVMASDNCDGNPILGFNQNSTQTSTGACSDFNYVITRIWTATDNCGNFISSTQIITVEDKIDPSFMAPVSVTVDCNNAGDLNITGMPSNVMDVCDPNPSVTFTDVISGGSCPNEYTITRTWIVEDACNNRTTQAQVITVQDNDAPVFVMGGAAQDVDLQCGPSSGFTTIFNEWITEHAGATALDNCSPENTLSWYALEPGAYNINDPSTYAAAAVSSMNNPTCPTAMPGVYQSTTVDFVVLDECDNAAVSTATFRVLDTAPPIFTSCPPNVTVSTDAGLCQADYVLPVPVIIDACDNTIGMPSFSVTEPIVSNNPGNIELPVNPVVLTFTGLPTAPSSITFPVTLTIDLNNVDGEEPTEYFTIQGEDGTNLGITIPTNDGGNPPTLLQCGNSSTLITTLSPGQVNAWASDGMITITLIPNIPTNLPGQFAINDICGNSTVTGTFSLNTITPLGITYEYSINAGPRVTVDPIMTVTETLPAGNNTIVYYATDCAGNEGTCTYMVSVEDDENPTIICPASFTVPSADCSPQVVSLPLPTGISDNCGFSNDYSGDAGLQTLSFTEHPNIDGFIVDDVFHDFFGTTPPPVSDGVLTVYLKGDIDNPTNEYFTIKDENGNILGQTASGAACGGFTTTTFTIPQADLLSWASDGVVKFFAEANVTSGIIAGADGDWNNDDEGINPCVTPGTFNGTETTVNDGGNTQMNMELSYFATTIAYALDGPTTIGFTGFPNDGSEPEVTLNPGVYAVTYGVTDASGNTQNCTYNITVGTPTLPTPTIVLSVVPNCPGDIVTLTETSGYVGTNPSWVWYEVGTGGIDPVIATTTDPMVSFPANSGITEYYVIIGDQNCTSDVSATISVDGGAALVEPILWASPTFGCEGEDVALHVSNVQADWMSYAWVGPNNYSGNTAFPPVIENASTFATGVYTLTVTNTAGCTISGNLFIQIYEAPVQPTIASNSPLCDGDDLILTSSSICETYLWIGPDGSSTSILSNPLLQTITNTTTIPPGNTAYDAGMWTVICVNANGCESEPSNAIEIEINNPITLAPTNNGPICEGDNIELTVGTATNASYQWTGPNNYISALPNPVIPNASSVNAGIYAVTVTDTDGCTGTGTTVVSIQTAPTVTAVSNDGSPCVTGADDIHLAVSVFPPDNGTYTYQWTGPNSFFSVDSMPTLPTGTSFDNGSYTVVVTNGANCISNALTTVVNVSDAPTTPTIAALDQFLCEGEILELTTNGYVGSSVTYTWTTPLGSQTTTSPTLMIANVSAINAGAYSVAVSVDGCDSNSSGTINVTVSATPEPPIAIHNGPVCEGETIQLSTAFIPGATYEWTGPSAFNSSIYNPIIPGASEINEGLYQVRLIVNGCASSFSSPVFVEVNPSPGIPIVLNNGPICIDNVGASVVLTISAASATPGASYTWYDAATGNQVGGPTSSLNFTLMDFSNYTNGTFDFYAVAELNGCVSTISVPTAVEMNTIPNTVAFAGTDEQICNGSSTILNAEAPTIGNGTWTQTGGSIVVIANPTAPNSSINGLMAGQSYTFTWTLSNGACGAYSSDDVIITVISTGELAEAGANINLCNVTSATLNATASTTGAVGTWTQAASQQALGVNIDNPADPNTTVSNLQVGSVYTFKWTLASVACGVLDDDQVIVTIEENSVVAYAGEDFVECGQGTIQLSAATPTSGTGTWSSTDPTLNIVAPNQVNTTVTGLNPGNYIFTWTLDNGSCGTTQDDVAVIFETNPVTANDQFNIPFGSSIELDVTTNDNLPSGAFVVNITSQPLHGTLLSIGNGMYNYLADVGYVGTDEFTYEICSNACPDDCSNQSIVSLTIGDDASCTIPTIMTPNGDNINDSFEIPCLSTGKFSKNEVAIFNQWGDEVFRAAPYQNDWNGTYNGNDLPPGTYFFVVDLGNGDKPKSGFLLIER